MCYLEHSIVTGNEYVVTKRVQIQQDSGKPQNDLDEDVTNLEVVAHRCRKEFGDRLLQRSIDHSGRFRRWSTLDVELLEDVSRKKASPYQDSLLRSVIPE